jgi:hypothetical protein
MNESIFADDFETERVHVGRSAVRHLTASSANIDRSAVQHLTAETVRASSSALGMTNGATVELQDSAAAFVAADYARVEGSRVLVLLAPRVSGNVRAVMTLPAAVAFGAGFFFARQLAQIMLARRSR